MCSLMPREPARRKARLAIEACILGADDLALGPEGLEDILLLQFLHDLGLQIWYFHKLRPSRAVYMSCMLYIEETCRAGVQAALW